MTNLEWVAEAARWTALVVGSAGLLTSTVFLGMVFTALLRFRRRKPLAYNAAPPMSILKPLHGAEPELEHNLETFFVQDYPAFEILFATRSADDPALAAVENLRRRYPQVAARTFVAGTPRHPNPKITSLEVMLQAARYECVAISDSDIRIPPDFLRKVAAEISQPGVGLVTCLYHGIPVRGFWSRMEALEMSVDMPAGVLVADMLEGMKFALGAAMITRKAVLAAIGGIGQTGDYYSDDFVLGSLVAAAGYQVKLSSAVVDHVLTDQNFLSCLSRQLRWNRSTRYSRPKGHLGSGLVYATPYGLLAAIAALALGHPTAAAAMLMWAILNRVAQALAVGATLKVRNLWTNALLYPVRDFIGFCAWTASFTGRNFRWRGERYRFESGGKVRRLASAEQNVAERVGI